MFKQVEQNPNFIEIENNLLKKWYSTGIVEKYLNKNNSSKKRFSFLDGPITANNPMGVHHSWGRMYKDLWQRYFNMKGYKQRFQNGYDCQGLWVEVEVEKELNFKSKRDIEKFGIAKFVELCKERVKKYSKIQTEQSKRLGYFMDWNNSYFTMSDENNYSIWHFLKKCNEKGFLYKGRDSVPWCARCGTAISQHEILSEEYKEITHKSVIFKLPVKGRDNEFLLAWTTTPWTIPGNVALAVDPKKDYVMAAGNVPGNKYYVIASKANSLGLKVEKKLKGQEIIGFEYLALFDEFPSVKKSLKGYTHRVVASDPVILPVSEEEGTGIIHIAPGAGSEDFKLGLKERLPVIEEIDELGVFMGGFNQLSGLPVSKASKEVLDYLQEKDFIFSESNYTHRYPTCWRCKSELVWRVVDEWYIGMDIKDKKDGLTLRQKLIKVAKKINWLPAFGLERELDWLKNMQDWLISKKRYWGLALPVWECEKCTYFEVIGGYEELKSRAVSGWGEFEGHTPHKPYIDKVKIKCSKCGNVMSRIPDVGNPWLDAGIVSFSTLIDPKTNKVSYLTDKKYWEQWFPADFITESFPGQFKNWFYSLIAMSTVLENTNPAKTIFGFATMLNSKGMPFHKSGPNSFEYIEGANRFGTDIIRFICAMQNPAHDILFGESLATAVRRQFYLILFNSYKFFITYARLDKFNPSEISLDNLTTIDRWVLSKLNSLILEVTNSLDKYDASSASKAIYDFVINSLSTWYIRRIRERVGPSAKDDLDRNTAHSVLYSVLVTLIKLTAPFMPFISDYMYLNLSDKEVSVHLEDWPIANNALINKEFEKDMDKVREVVEKIHSWRKLENIRVRMPLKEVQYSISAKLDTGLEDIICEETNVKKLVYKKGSGISVKILDTGEDDETILAEGYARDMIRDIQDLRKQSKCKFDSRVSITYPQNRYTSLALKIFKEYIKKASLVNVLKPGSKYEIIKKI